METAFAQKVANLPTRWLPPGSIKMLYHEFVLTNPRISYLVSSFELINFIYPALLQNSNSRPAVRVRNLGMGHFGDALDRPGPISFASPHSQITVRVIPAWTAKKGLKMPSNLGSLLDSIYGMSKRLMRFDDECYTSLRPILTKDAQQKFETARFYKNHLRCVTQDRELEEWFQDGVLSQST